MTARAAPVRIATRKSPLALWQARHVAALLERHHPGLEVELLELSTEGDRFLAAPLSQIGGKGLFVKEIEQALIDRRADLAVHSLKDMTSELPAGLELAALPEREDPRDAFVGRREGDRSRSRRGGRRDLVAAADLPAARAPAGAEGRVDSRQRADPAAQDGGAGPRRRDARAAPA